MTFHFVDLLGSLFCSAVQERLLNLMQKYTSCQVVIDLCH